MKYSRNATIKWRPCKMATYTLMMASQIYRKEIMQMFRNYLVDLIVTLIIKIYAVTETKLSMMAVDYILDGVRREFATRDLRGE